MRDQRHIAADGAWQGSLFPFPPTEFVYSITNLKSTCDKSDDIGVIPSRERILTRSLLTKRKHREW